MKILPIFLILATFLTGLLGGIGFVNFIGFGPAFRDTPAKDIIRYWQTLDGYMGARMPVFGSAILLSLLGSFFLVMRQSYKKSLWLLILALTFILADLFIAAHYNFPFNRLVQRISPETIPDNFGYIRSKSVFGFTIRSICMMGAFASTLSALFLQASKKQSR